MSFFAFNQNNSGGSFAVNESVAHSVIIEADSPQSANERALEIGIYFNGCADDIDCDCCGDRWSSLDDNENGDRIPSVYGVPITKAKSGAFDGPFRDQVRVHMLDGRVISLTSIAEAIEAFGEYQEPAT